MSEKLTPQQKTAVENRGGKLLVSAAAGSGKTKVLVDRLMSYLLDPHDPANLDDFLIITYTKAAASELRGKISDKLTKYIAEHPDNRHMHQQIQRLHLAKISTVHAFCADILREYAFRLDISSDFRIAEETECQEMMYNILQQILDDAYTEKIDDPAFRAFVDTQGLGRDDRLLPEIILQTYSSALCHLDPIRWLDWCLSSAQVSQQEDASKTVWGRFLMDDLKEYLTLQINSLKHCICCAAAVDGLEKPVALLTATVKSLESLRSCDTWDAIVAHSPIEYGTLTFKKEHKGSLLAEQIKAIRNACKEGLSKKLQSFSNPSSVAMAHLQESNLACTGLVRLVKDFLQQYDKMKKARHVLDFSDIEQRMLDLLVGKQRGAVTLTAEEIGSRFREIMVDEYQDSNEVQDAIFSALTGKRHNCFMVGDVKQSIYQFRLADPDIFLEKYNTFAPAETAEVGEGRKVLLSSNFRSSGGVISAVNDVFTQTMTPNVGGLLYGDEEMLREGIPHLPLNDQEVELCCIDVREDTYQEEAAAVAQRIHELLDGNHMVREADTLRPITADDIVILLRSPGSVGGEFRYALECAGIPCVMGNDTDLLQTPEVETLRSILMIVHNPLQDIPLIAALTSPVFGFTADDLALMRGKNRHISFYKALESSDLPKAVAFLQLLSQLRSSARFLTISQLIYLIFTKTGMLSIYGAMDNGDEKVNNLQGFSQIAVEYESTGRKDLTYFLTYLTSAEEKGLSVAGNTPTGAVQIMSIHKSKGLEFPVVFLCGLSRSFNMSDLQKQVLCHKDLGLGLAYINQVQRVRFPTIAKRAISTMILKETLSEELRVLYVAMTRARDRLIMTYASSRLEDRLMDIAYRLDLSDRELLTAHVNCPGTWILLSAMQRTEAGELFQMAEKPDCSSVHNEPWRIHVVQAEETTYESSDSSAQTDIEITEAVEKIKRGLAFCYSHEKATKIPSKLTATQLKGRTKDMEAAEYAGQLQAQSYTFMNPEIKKSAIHGTEYGNAVHAIMQFVDFRCCSSEETLIRDIERMVTDGLVTKDQASAVDISKIVRFFRSDLGLKIVSGKEVLREFKFSILEDANEYYNGVNSDKILLQGVVDCAIIDESGITITDFKTDYITPSNLQAKIAQYTGQINTYAKAMSRIFELPVKEKYLYFFNTEQLISVD